MLPAPATFFSCDWGTSSFRLREVDRRSGRVVQELREPAGVKSLLEECREGDAECRELVFSEFLQERLQRLLESHAPSSRPAGGPVFVLVSGMASSSVGWREIPYSAESLALDGSTLRSELIRLPLRGDRLAQVRLISGVSLGSEIMRGEETELLGLFASTLPSTLRGASCVILPGTHSKHLRVLNSRVVGICTYMTGELFDVLSTHSLLRASVDLLVAGTVDSVLRQPASLEAFLEGVEAAAGVGLAASLFQVRTRSVLQRVPPRVNRWYLSGLLIGAELSGLVKDTEAISIVLGATEPVSRPYEVALERLGLKARTRVVPAAEMALASVNGHRLLLDRLLGGLPDSSTP